MPTSMMPTSTMPTSKMLTSSAIELSELLDPPASPCLSLYQPTYRSPPEQVQNPIRYDNLLKQLRGTLHDRVGKREADELVAPLVSLAANPALFKPVFEGLAVLSCRGLLRVVKTHRPVPELALVADSFHLKPLIRILQTADRFQILGISGSQARLFEGNRDTLEELEPGDGVPRSIMEALPEEYTDPSMPPGVDLESRKGFGGPVVHVAPRSRVDALDTDIERFFRVVGRAVTEHHSRRSKLPLILVALPQHQAAFRQESENPYLLPEAIEADPEALSLDDLRQRAWKLFEPLYVEKLQNLAEEFCTAKSHHKGSDDLFQLAEAAAMSRVRVLLLNDSQQHAAGRIDPTTGAVEFSGDDDVYDDLAELVLRRGGEVIVTSPQNMPTPAAAAGIYRF